MDKIAIEAIKINILREIEVYNTEGNFYGVLKQVRDYFSTNPVKAYRAKRVWYRGVIVQLIHRRATQSRSAGTDYTAQVSYL